MNPDRYITDPDWLEAETVESCDGSAFCQCPDCCADEAAATYGRERP
jgi:hypothetical protein